MTPANEFLSTPISVDRITDNFIEHELAYLQEQWQAIKDSGYINWRDRPLFCAE